MANPTLDMLQGILYGNGIRLGRLSGLGRYMAAMVGTYPDHVPFMGPQIHDHAMTVARVPARRYYWDAELLVDTQISIERWYGFDVYTIVPDAYNFEVEALGGKMIYSDDAMPTVDTNQPLIRERADLERIGPLDTSKGRIPMGVECGRLFTEKAPGPFAAGFFCSPFSFMCQAMGYPGAIRAIKRNKDFAREFFAYAEEQVIWPYLEDMARAGVKTALGPDAWAAFPNLTPDLVEEWVVPSTKRLTERGKKELKMTVSAGAAACDYCEEDPEKFDRDIMNRCWDVSCKMIFIPVVMSAMGRTQDWPMEWMQEYATSQKGKKITIMASLNGRFMRDSTPEQIVDLIRKWIDIMGRDGKLIFFIGNVPADTPVENIHIAAHAVRTLGKYPIAEDLSSIPVEIPPFKSYDEWLKDQPEAETIYRAREWKPEAKVFA